MLKASQIVVTFFVTMIAIGCQKKEEDSVPAVVEGTMDNSGPYPVIKMPSGLQYHTGLLHKEPENKGFGSEHVILTDCGALPDEFDLRTMGLVSDIKDQGSCGSCWSFSKTNSLESALLGQGKKLNLAEQELVSCDSHNWGCEGGLLDDYDYQISHGQGLESDFPYTSGNTGRNGNCKNVPVNGKGISFQYVGTAERGPTVDELKCALFKYKTVPWITVGATNAWGSPPASEHTMYNRCGAAQTNHAVGVVGWHTINGKVGFIMKNSWGTGWGDKGYMTLPLGCNNFGEEVAFIQVAGEPTPTPTPTPPGPSPTPPGPTPTPPPCTTAPNVKLPAEVQVFAGANTMLGVKSEAGVHYVWSSEGKILGNESMLYIVPPKDAVYKLQGQNDCAIAESIVRVRIVMSAKH